MSVSVEPPRVPLVSILIPCRNAGAWLPRCVESALAQTHANIEVIVYDDGSTDGCVDALLQIQDPRLRLMRGPGEGGNTARNHLLSAAAGEWIQYLDADDYLAPGKIERQLAEAASEFGSADALLSPVWQEVWTGEAPGPRSHEPLADSDDLVSLWLGWRFPQTGGPLWRASSLRGLGGWLEGLPCCQDNELYLRALQAGLRWSICPSPGAVYRVWSGETVSRGNIARVLAMRTELTDRMLAWLKQNGLMTKTREQAASRAYFEMARTMAKTDIAAAAAYHRKNRRKVAVPPSGPSAPASYRLMLALFGFAAAEKCAALRRRIFSRA